MCFPCYSYVMMLPKPLVFVLLLLDCCSFSFSYVLHALGLRPYPHATLIPPWDDYALYLQSTSPPPPPSSTIILLPQPHSAPPAGASPVTERLRVLQFDIFSKKKKKLKLASAPAAAAAEAEEEEDDAVCAVCLAEFTGEHSWVRELGNCDHAFHAACIDRWAETGHATCPLCRSPLLPPPPPPPPLPPRSCEKPRGAWFRR